VKTATQRREAAVAEAVTSTQAAAPSRNRSAQVMQYVADAGAEAPYRTLVLAVLALNLLALASLLMLPPVREWARDRLLPSGRRPGA
jgi:hypothetical protein